MKAKVDADVCTGCGLCPQICPEIFEIQDDVAVVLMDAIPKELEATCRDAAESCPVSAISIAE